MVKVALKISCIVENIDEIFTAGLSSPWTLKLQCRSCNEIDQNWHSFSAEEEVPAFQGPGTFNFQMKCKFCSTVFSIDVVKDSIKPLKVAENGMINKQTAVVFDCRGVEPVEYDPGDAWEAKCEETGTHFPDVEFDEDGMWAGYDNKGNFPVTIDKFKGEFERA